MQAQKTPVTITVAGKMTDPKFQKCVTAVRHLERENPEVVTGVVLQFFETQWEEYIKKTANSKKGVFYSHTGSHLVFLNENEYVGNQEQFAKYALHNFAYMDNSHVIIYEKKAADAYRNAINNSKTRKYAAITLSFQGQETTVVVELFQDLAPRTVANFLGLCNGHKREDGEMLSYVDSEVHRVVPGMYVQCGRIETAKNPEKGTSIYGGEFEDESFQVRHTEIGLLGMCKRNGLKHTNQSQFYITMGAPMSFLDGENVIFGRVIQGMRALKLIEKFECTNERPNEPVRIVKCGTYTKQ